MSVRAFPIPLILDPPCLWSLNGDGGNKKRPFALVHSSLLLFLRPKWELEERKGRMAETNGRGDNSPSPQVMPR